MRTYLPNSNQKLGNLRSNCKHGETPCIAISGGPTTLPGRIAIPRDFSDDMTVGEAYTRIDEDLYLLTGGESVRFAFHHVEMWSDKMADKLTNNLQEKLNKYRNKSAPKTKRKILKKTVTEDSWAANLKLGEVPLPPFNPYETKHNQTELKVTPQSIHKLAASGDVPELKKLMSNNSVDINLKDEHGKTALHFSAYTADSSSMLGYLLKNGANPNIADSMGNTPLHMVAYASLSVIQFYIAKELITAGAAPTMTNKAGQTPFDCFIEHDQLYNFDCGIQLFMRLQTENNWSSISKAMKLDSNKHDYTEMQAAFYLAVYVFVSGKDFDESDKKAFESLTSESSKSTIEQLWSKVRIYSTFFKDKELKVKKVKKVKKAEISHEQSENLKKTAQPSSLKAENKNKIETKKEKIEVLNYPISLTDRKTAPTSSEEINVIRQRVSEFATANVTYILDMGHMKDKNFYFQTKATKLRESYKNGVTALTKCGLKHLDDYVYLNTKHRTKELHGIKLNIPLKTYSFRGAINVLSIIENLDLKMIAAIKILYTNDINGDNQSIDGHTAPVEVYFNSDASSSDIAEAIDLIDSKLSATQKEFNLNFDEGDKSKKGLFLATTSENNCAYSMSDMSDIQDSLSKLRTSKNEIKDSIPKDSVSLKDILTSDFTKLPKQLQTLLDTSTPYVDSKDLEENWNSLDCHGRVQLLYRLPTIQGGWVGLLDSEAYKAANLNKLMIPPKSWLGTGNEQLPEIKANRKVLLKKAARDMDEAVKEQSLLVSRPSPLGVSTGLMNSISSRAQQLDIGSACDALNDALKKIVTSEEEFSEFQIQTSGLSILSLFSANAKDLEKQLQLINSLIQKITKLPNSPEINQLKNTTINLLANMQSRVTEVINKINLPNFNSDLTNKDFERLDALLKQRPPIMESEKPIGDIISNIGVLKLANYLNKGLFIKDGKANMKDSRKNLADKLLDALIGGNKPQLEGAETSLLNTSNTLKQIYSRDVLPNLDSIENSKAGYAISNT